ncbi:hypothetical protein VTL71DRAFT_5431 [Oculimacula yallundae]|uniref:Proline dehydrogenase n=1 Tax=Oculimacula yallundae TaxID=86028 RepID=A0ABR4C126_9HELO
MAITKGLKSRTASILSNRYISSQTLPRRSSITSDHASSDKYPIQSIDTTTSSTMPKPSPLSILPTSSILRSLATMSISSSPILLKPSLAIMSKLAHSQSAILSPDSNPLLRFFLKRTFYKQFCAGETEAEVKQTVDGLLNLGFSGVILAYAKEVVLDKNQTEALASSANNEAAEACIRNEITPWEKGVRETILMTRAGDYAALKFTGAGSQALYDLSKQADPSPALKEAIDSICDLAVERGVKLLFDAEQTALQPGIDAWTLKYMEKYNKTSNGEAVIFGTYQAYLKSVPSVVAQHMEAARKGGFTLGVKLVRGAYLGSDPRHLICDTKADTDAAYDGIAEALVRKSYNSILKPLSSLESNSAETPPFPSISLVLAGHNLNSVRKVQAICTTQKQNGEKSPDVIYAQLQGMADEVSCELVLAGKLALAKGSSDVPKAYKYLVWGTTGECMKYLHRRAQENKDAVGRTREGRNQMAGEIWRRVKMAFGGSV